MPVFLLVYPSTPALWLPNNNNSNLLKVLMTYVTLILSALTWQLKLAKLQKLKCALHCTCILHKQLSGQWKAQRSTESTGSFLRIMSVSKTVQSHLQMACQSPSSRSSRSLQTKNKHLIHAYSWKVRVQVQESTIWNFQNSEIDSDNRKTSKLLKKGKGMCTVYWPLPLCFQPLIMQYLLIELCIIFNAISFWRHLWWETGCHDMKTCYESESANQVHNCKQLFSTNIQRSPRERRQRLENLRDPDRQTQWHKYQHVLAATVGSGLVDSTNATLVSHSSHKEICFTIESGSIEPKHHGDMSSAQLFICLARTSQH